MADCENGMSVSREIQSIYARGGADAYFGEAVTQVEHGLQAAYFAAASGASEALVLAALLHDIGHLIEPAPADIAEWRHDACHERSGSRWLAAHFGPVVHEPVRLHVAAKRYLCATDRAYVRRLSSASIHTLGLQGGPMTALEVAAFEAEAFGRDAVLLRQWDDQGKVRGLRTPDFTEYLPLMERLSAGGVSSLRAVE